MIFISNAKTVKKPRYVRELLDRCGPYNRRYGRGIKQSFRIRRYQFSRPGFRSIRLPGKLWSPEFMAAYQIAWSCQINLPPTKPNPALAGHIRFCADILFETPSFKLLQSGTRHTYRQMVENLCVRIGGERPLKAKQSRSGAARYKRLSAKQIDTQLIKLSQLIKAAVPNNRTGKPLAFDFRRRPQKPVRITDLRLRHKLQRILIGLKARAEDERQRRAQECAECR